MAPQKYLDLYDPEKLSVPEFPVEIERQRPRKPGQRFSDAHLRRAKQGYYAMISEVDDHVGRILGALDAEGLRENTVVVFTSDHGEWLGTHLKFGKGYPADDAVSRVPLIVSAPDGKSGKNVDDIVEAVDIVPTLLSLAGIQAPPTLQGVSLADVVMMGAEVPKQAALTEGDGWKCLRNRDYRYLIHSDGSECLWHIKSDPGEYADLVNDPAHQPALARCRRQLLERLLQMERPLSRTWTY